MANDPTDDAVRESARPKHEPPTIDLEASEVLGETNAAADAKPARAPMAGLLTPLLSGAVAALAVCGALWAGGVIGIEPQAAAPQPVSSADHAALVARANDLTGRLAKLEARPQSTPAPQTPSVDPARFAAVEKSVAALREDVAALRDELAKRAAPSDTASAANAAPQMAALAARLTKLEQTPRIEVTAPPPPVADDLPLRRATIAAALDAQVQRGESFAALLASAKQIAAKPDALATLERFASSGLPSDAALSRDLLALLPQLTPKPEPAKQASSSDSETAGFLERLQTSAAKLVHLERVDAGAASSAKPSALAAIEAAAKRNDIAAARRAIDQLPQDARALTKPWTDAVDAREAARSASRQFAQESMTPLAKAAQ